MGFGISSVGKKSSKAEKRKTVSSKDEDLKRDAFSDSIMPSMLDSKQLTYNSTGSGVYVQWLFNMLKAGEQVDALVEISNGTRSRYDLAHQLLASAADTDSDLPEDYFDSRGIPDDANSSSNNECEVELI